MGLFDSIGGALGGIFSGNAFSGVQNQAQGLPPGATIPDYSQFLTQSLQQGYDLNNNALNQSNDSRKQQQDFIAALQANAQGKGPSVAALQQQQGLQQAQQAAAGQAASMRGINPALAARLASQSQANLASQNAGQMGLLRAQEQLQNQNLLGNTLGGLRQQDIMQGLGQLQANRAQTQGIGGLVGAQQGLSANIGQKNAEFGQGVVTGAIGGGAGGAGSALAKASLAYSGGEIQNNDSKANAFLSALKAEQGGKVPGEAEVDGDSPKNDKVHAMLSPGEIIIPRSIAKDPEAAKDFVEAIHKRHKKATGYSDVIRAKAS